jgi:phenylalanyl-tRNA synthetase beta chain
MIKASNGDILGNLGEISKKTYKHFGLKKMRVAIMELDIRMLLEKSSTYTKYVSLPKFPETERDLSMIVGEQTRVADVERLLYSAGKSLVSDIDLFDLYTNPETSERSMAFHIKFSHPKKTLTAKEVDTKILEMIKSLEKELGITVRTNQ